MDKLKTSDDKKNIIVPSEVEVEIDSNSAFDIDIKENSD
jgi:hypothetical protein